VLIHFRNFFPNPGSVSPLADCETNSVCR